ncbi:MAG: hypothetical protein AAB564_01430 [Patescibacteria group bacterium]
MGNNKNDSGERAAWRRLFSGRTEVEIAVIINTFYLDSAYEIIVLKLDGTVVAATNFVPPVNLKNQNQHHRRPRSIGGKSGGKNVIWVNRDDHFAWHKLFRNFMPEKIAEIINKKWLDPNSDYRFTAVCLTDAKDDGVAGMFCCEICGESYFNEIEYRKCRRKGWRAPRFARGEKVLIKIKGCPPQIGTIADWDNSFSISLHFYEKYTVEYSDGKIKSVDARNIKYVLKDNGRKEKRKKYIVFSKKALKKAKKRKGFI